MMRQILSVVWAASVAVSISGVLLFVGSLLHEHTNVLAFVAIGAAIVMMAGLVFYEIDGRAFNRGVEAAEETRRIEKEARLP